MNCKYVIKKCKLLKIKRLNRCLMCRIQRSESSFYKLNYSKIKSRKFIIKYKNNKKIIKMIY